MGGTDQPIRRSGFAVRPLTVAQRLDDALELFRTHFTSFVIIAVVCALPVHLLSSLVNARLGGVGGLGDLFGASGTTEGAVATSAPALEMFAGLVLAFIGSLPQAVAGVAVSHVVLADLQGRPTGVGPAARATLRNAPVLLVAWLVSRLAQMVGLAMCGIGLIVPLVWFSLLAPVIAVEGGSVGEVLGRARRLGSRRFFPILGVSMCGGLVAILISGLPTALGSLAQIATLDSQPGWYWVVNLAAGLAVGVLRIPFVAALAVTMYFDGRSRTEGLDLELDCVGRFGATP